MNQTIVFIFICLKMMTILVSSQLVVQNDPHSNFYSFASPDRQVSFHRNFQPVQNYQRLQQPLGYSNPIPQQNFNSQPAFAFNQQLMPQQNVDYSQQPSIVYAQQPNFRNVAPIMHEVQRDQPQVVEHQPIKYSYSSDAGVSSVKFSSNGLNYNF